tara:strand:+ start:3321 stop:3572 length:252 start_codon:yes stop_codon:yes gene_type:complete
MSVKKTDEILLHPEHGRLPARRLIECIFALSPAGPILHHHIEEVDVRTEGDATIYTLNGAAPGAERYRCQVIPPLVPQFPVLD